MKSLLILGGGFAGVQAAIAAQKKGLFKVTLISDKEYLYLNPISIWIPVKKINPELVKVPLSEIQKAHGFTVIVDAVQKVDAVQNKVMTSHGEISYDYLIIATGAEKTSLPGQENTLSICGTLETAKAIESKLDAMLTSGGGNIAVGFGGNPKDKSAVRGGPAFELIFNILYYVKQKGMRDKFNFTFFAPMPEPGQRMGKDALAMVDHLFKKEKINKQYGKKITGFEANKIQFEDSITLEADLILFIPGLKGHRIFTNSGLPLNEAGFIQIDDTGLVAGTANIFAVGDVAALEGPDWRAKQGHTAEVMARNAVENIVGIEQGSSTRLGYQEHLNILCIMDTGDGAAFVYRDDKRAFVIPLPVIGHWLKKGWGWYARMTKLGKFPRIPGL